MRPTIREQNEGIENFQKSFDPNKGFRAGSDRDTLFNFMLNGTTAEEMLDVFPHKKINRIKWEMGSIAIMVGKYYNQIENNGRVKLVRK
jgi:hypothetical protein